MLPATVIFLKPLVCSAETNSREALLQRIEKHAIKLGYGQEGDYTD